MLALFLLPGSREKARLTMAKKVSKKERKENAKEFYYLLQKGNCDKVAIVVRKIDSSNVNYCRCQFLSVISNVAWGDAKVLEGDERLIVFEFGENYDLVLHIYKDEEFNSKKDADYANIVRISTAQNGAFVDDTEDVYVTDGSLRRELERINKYQDFSTL